MSAENRPGRFGYFAAVVIAVGSVIGCAVLIVMSITGLEHDVRFVAPGSQDFTIEKPGTQTIWNDYRTVYGGRSFDLPEQLPDGLQIRVYAYNGTSGKSLDIVPNRGASSKTSEAERVSVASFEATTPGRYAIVIDGNFPQRVFSVGPNIGLRIVGAIFGAVAVILAGFATAMGVAIWTFIRRHPSVPTPRPETVSGSAASGAAPSPASPVIAVTTPPEESARQMAIAVYALQAVSFVVVVSMIGGVILNYVKREDAAGTWLESHYTWQIRTFWWWLAWMVVAAILAIIVVGIAVAIVNQIWLLYRILKGWLRLSERRPMY